MRNSDYVELYQMVSKLESDMEGNESIKQWKRSIERIKMDLFETVCALTKVLPELNIKSTDGSVVYSIKGDNLIDILGLDDLAQGESYAIKYCTNPKYKTGINDPMLNKFKDFITVVRTPDGIFYTGYR